MRVRKMSGRTHLIYVTLEIGDDLRSSLLCLLVEKEGNRNHGKDMGWLDIECMKWETQETRGAERINPISGGTHLTMMLEVGD
jgi:hypothetical protein